MRTQLHLVAIQLCKDCERTDDTVVSGILLTLFFTQNSFGT